MNKDVYKYFLDLSEDYFDKEKNTIILPSKDIQVFEKVNRDLRKFTHKGTPFYLKKWNGINSIFSVASSKMYNDLGIITPPNEITMTDRTFHDDSLKFSTLCQDVFSAKYVEVVLANNIPQFKKIKNKFYYLNFKWELLYDTPLKDYFLSFMTEDCFNQFVNLFLADELRTDCDRHLENFFLYKSKNSDKFEGVIAIDLEAGLICSYYDNRFGDFDTYRYTKFQTAMPTGNYDDEAYINRLRNIRELLDDGVLDESNINLLKELLSYDFPSNFKKITPKEVYKTNRQKRDLCKTINKLWEYNQKTLGKDLGL